MKILVINGPNLNFLGIREKNIYGNENYEYLVNMINEYCKSKNIEVECYQSNHEGAIIDKIQEAYFNGTDGIVINPGAYTHYSYAIRDALASVSHKKKIEVHISNVNEREEFRHNSMFADVCVGQITGFKIDSYKLGLQGLVNFLTSAND